MHKFVKFVGVGMLVAVLSACQTLGAGYISASEMDEFQALPTEKRVMNEVRIRWEVREDVAAYCAKASGMGREQAYVTPPLACAIWSTSQKECTIVTSRTTTHVALGHEVRHCFEGHFHR